LHSGGSARAMVLDAGERAENRADVIPCLIDHPTWGHRKSFSILKSCKFCPQMGSVGGVWISDLREVSLEP
jgi:hypothetical protein